MSKQQKVSIIIPEIGCGGGAERVAVNLANAFVARGVAVDLVVMSADDEFASPLDPRVQLVNLRVQRIRGLLWPLVRYLRKNRPTAVLACMWPVALISLLARKLARVCTRTVVAEHNTLSLSEQRRPRIQRWLMVTSLRVFYPLADGVVTVSKGVADDLAKLTGLPRDAIFTIYNPIVSSDSTAVSHKVLAATTNWELAQVKILNVGRMKVQKDQETLLRAFCALAKHVDAYLLILGEGELRSKLEALSESLGISSRVSFAGLVSDPEYYYERASLFVLSSHWEGFGNVVVEALAAGIPVVSTDCRSGPREILADGKFGRLVPVGDPDALAAAMESALSEIPDREALRARAQDFTIDRSADQYLALLLPEQRHDGCV